MQMNILKVEIVITGPRWLNKNSYDKSLFSYSTNHLY